MQSPTASVPTRRTVSLAVAIIMLIVGGGVGAGVIYVALPRETTTTPTQAANTLCSSPFITNPAGCKSVCSSGSTYTIGELLDLSKDLASQGTRAKDSSAIAITDINAFLSAGGCNLKFANSVSDYALDNPTALTQLQSFGTSGVQVVVGPLNSGAAQYILSYADSNHIVLISPSSTSPALALDNDYLFRTVPNDAAQGLADARMLIDRGATAAIIVNRDDTYGNGLANATKVRFTALGGTVIDTIKYDTSITDFTTVLTTLQTDFNNNVGTYGADRIAIDVIAFEEFGTMIIQASTNFPNFPWSTLPWFGTDGQATDSVIIAGQSGTLTAQVRLPSTLYASTNNPKTTALNSTFYTKTSQICDSYCLGAYDDLWLAAISTLEAGAYDGVKIQAVISTVAAGFYGVTGPLAMQPSGDRIPTSYQIWKAVNPSGTPKWVLAGTWDLASDSITWTSPP